MLEGRGVDLFMVETFYDLDELETAIDAVRSVSSLPIVALLTFDADGETLAGVKAEDAAARLRPLGLAAFGANHGAGPAAALTALAQMGGDGDVLAALPNVGLASMSGQRIVFPHATPAYFGEFAAQARALGARRDRRLLRHDAGPGRRDPRRGRRRTAARRLLPRPGARAGRRPSSRRRGETQLARLLREGEFAVSVQVDPPLGANPEALIETARAVRDSGRAQFVDVNDNPRARARMSGIMASVAIERFTGVETIPHLTPRDTTIAGLESLLLGAHAEGVRNILAVTGDPPEAGDYPGTHAVYDVDSVGLVELIAKLNAGEDWHGRAIDAPTTFFPGAAVNPTADDLGLEAERFHRKVAAGARFAMTQILFDLEVARGVPGADRRLAGAGARRRLADPHDRDARPRPQRGARDRRPGARAGAVPRRGAGRARGRARARAGADRGRARARDGVYVVAPFRRPLDVVELLPEPA